MNMDIEATEAGSGTDLPESVTVTGITGPVEVGAVGE